MDLLNELTDQSQLLSVEEAKKRMYALSTTTYHGFQAVMTEEMSEKFHGNLYE